MTIDTRSQKDNPSISVIIEIISLENILQLLIESNSIYEGERKKKPFSLKNTAYEFYLLTEKFDTIWKIKQLT